MWFNVGLYCHAPWRHMKGRSRDIYGAWRRTSLGWLLACDVRGRSRDIYGAGAGDGLAQDIPPHPGAMMNFNDQNRNCHAERMSRSSEPFASLKGKLREGEASLCPWRETLRFPFAALRASAHSG